MWLVLFLLAAADLAGILQSLDNPATRAAAQRSLIALAESGDPSARLEAALRSRKGELPALPAARATRWFAQALKARIPLACLEQAKIEIDARKNPEPMLRCAAQARIPESRYLLGRLLLNRSAAEDEPQRFEGLALLALSAKAGYAPALRRWDLLLDDLTAEDIERVEQTANRLDFGQ
ncbi:hypothetical protein [Bryobacter aggregatus]|uniref:hypothetical protein n=1 Tax=Bryobacter aggregatus TaxID=360054 RepID=UPI0004E157F9|nr:hypothetical protein [Bryobacter aggregatus]